MLYWYKFPTWPDDEEISGGRFSWFPSLSRKMQEQILQQVTDDFIQDFGECLRMRFVI